MVAERQQKLLKQAEQYGAEKSEINTMVDQQMNILRDKLKSMRPIFDQINQNSPTKRKIEIEEAGFAKKLRISSKENQHWNSSNQL